MGRTFSACTTVHLKEVGSGYIPLGAFLRRCIPFHVNFLAGGRSARKGGSSDRDYQAEGDN